MSERLTYAQQRALISIYNAAIYMGYPPATAATMAGGGAFWESGLNPYASGDGGSSVGFYQVNPRFQNQMIREGVDRTDPAAVTQRYLEQIQRMSPTLNDALLSATNPSEAIRAFMADPNFTWGTPSSFGGRLGITNQVLELVDGRPQASTGGNILGGRPTLGLGGDLSLGSDLNASFESLFGNGPAAVPSMSPLELYGFNPENFLSNPAPPESPFFGAETYRGPDLPNPGFDEQFMLPTGGDVYRGPGPGDTPNTFGASRTGDVPTNPGFDEQFMLPSGGDIYRTGVSAPGYSNPAPYESPFSFGEPYQLSNTAPFDDMMPSFTEPYQLPDPFNPSIDDQFALPTPTEPYQLEPNPGFDEQFVLPTETFPWQLPDVVDSGPSAVPIDPFAWNIVEYTAGGEPIYGNTALDPNIVEFDPYTGEPIYGNIPMPILSPGDPRRGMQVNLFGGLAPGGSSSDGYTNPDGTPFNPGGFSGPGGGVLVGSPGFGAGLSGVGGWLRTSMFRPGDNPLDYLIGRGA